MVLALFHEGSMCYSFHCADKKKRKSQLPFRSSLSQVQESSVLCSRAGQARVPPNQTKKRVQRSDSASLALLKSIYSSREKPHEITGSIHTNEYECNAVQVRHKLQLPLLSHNQECWASARMINDHTTEGANSPVYLCIYLRQK